MITRIRSWIQSPSIKVMTALIVALMLINAVAIWELISALGSAESIALQDLRLQTTAHARSLEAVLASRRGDFIFLSQSPPIGDALAFLSSKNPISRKWGRLDLEGSLLLFLVGHADVERLVIRDAASRPLMVAGRREGVPVLLA